MRIELHRSNETIKILFEPIINNFLITRSFSSSLFNFDKYSFENTIENLNTVAEETHDDIDDAILYDVKEVIRDEKRFYMFLTF